MKHSIPALFKTFPNFGARTVGYDQLFDMMEHFTTDIPTYPPYNILGIGEDKYQIVVAAAGFSKDEISIEKIKNDLVVKASSKSEEGSDQTTFIHRGLAMRDFVLKFKVANNVEVQGASFVNGLLKIELTTVTPDEEKALSIQID